MREGEIISYEWKGIIPYEWKGVVISYELNNISAFKIVYMAVK